MFLDSRRPADGAGVAPACAKKRRIHGPGNLGGGSSGREFKPIPIWAVSKRSAVFGRLVWMGQGPWRADNKVVARRTAHRQTAWPRAASATDDRVAELDQRARGATREGKNRRRPGGKKKKKEGRAGGNPRRALRRDAAGIFAFRAAFPSQPGVAYYMTGGVIRGV